MSSILKVDQIQLSNGNTPTAGDLGLNTTGSVLQVQHHIKSGETVVSDTAGATTVFSGSITPTSASSKILILMSHNMYVGGVTTTGSFGEKILRGSTEIYNKSEVWYVGGTQDMFEAWSTNFYDSPSTTSSITYNYQVVPSSSRGTLKYNRGGGNATMTLIEIAG